MSIELAVIFPSNQDKYSNFKLSNLNQLDTVGELRRLIALRFYLPPNNFQLIYNQKHITDDKYRLQQLFKPSIKRIYAVPILSLTPESEEVRRAEQNRIDLNARDSIQKDIDKWMFQFTQPPKQYKEEMEKLQLMLENNNHPARKMEMLNQLIINDGDVERTFQRLTRCQ